ncbi:MAG: alanine--glyoxylate aminotransferase family protein [Chloroflexi bacterium]|nr:alanine--glyoxylate aminotransferase family protein [Chloroflexota bacterium]MCI0580605.1 alanine--glyoxylate aminotransferase family protein [Chloroflexota bacterium]MCI0648873.1 alanine--glyoxylate aminotransferase family protein [Chloroflexota bacterium]MCI0728203.1 alanine--glyoxylate aminotransferase family protein [Chloroflexota bacterium]
MNPINETHRIQTGQLDVPPRLLLGPGPSNAHPRVLQALGMRQVGHLDPHFIALMNDIQELLRYAWQTDNELTIPVSGTGSAAMEASLANTVEPGDVVLVGVNGYFGERLVDMAGRYGADVRRLEKEWGQTFTLDELRAGLEKHRPAILALVHAETSTGARQPLEGVGQLCRELDCLLLVDTVTSLGGVPLFLDAWDIDLAYSGSQKCLSCPPGLAPLTLGPRAVARLHNRQTKVANWYLDMSQLGRYWGSERTYHHTAPINMNYALREALRLVAGEGLEARWARHQANAELLWDGLEALGLACHVAREFRLPSLTTVRVPEGVDARVVARTLLNDYNIEIAGGFGPLAGKIWRIGLMGFNSRRENVLLLLSALERVLS